MIACKEVFEKSPHKPKVVEKILNEEGLKVFMGYTFFAE
jgi:predicted regulator of amino acid metabolism with ACT domain